MPDDPFMDLVQSLQVPGNFDVVARHRSRHCGQELETRPPEKIEVYEAGNVKGLELTHAGDGGYLHFRVCFAPLQKIDGLERSGRSRNQVYPHPEAFRG